MLESDIKIMNRLGLHARASAKWVNTASAYTAEVTLAKEGQVVNGKSIMGVMMLAASYGTQLQLQVTGEDEQQAMQALLHLVDDRFGEHN